MSSILNKKFSQSQPRRPPTRVAVLEQACSGACVKHRIHGRPFGTESIRRLAQTSLQRARRSPQRTPHNPVGQSMNSHGILNFFDKCAASAFTPKTSVA